MRPSKIASLFIGTFLIVTFLLQWWQLTSYPLWLWIALGLFMCFRLPKILIPKSSKVGWAPRATGGVAAGGGALARGGFFFASFFCPADKRKKISITAYICVPCLAVALAFWTVARATKDIMSQTIPSYASQKITLLGTVTSDPGGKPPSALYSVAVDAIDHSGTLIPVTGSVLVEDFGGWPPYHIGDRIHAAGTLELPKSTDDFNYAHFLRLQGVTAILRRATMKTSDNSAVQQLNTPSSIYHLPSVLSLRRPLQSTRLWFESRINRLFPEPQAALITGLLTGERRGFSKRLLDEFSTTGLTHLIAISGTNVTIIIGMLGGFLFWLPLKWRFLPQVIAIILFTLFVGASASVVRAAIMGMLGLTALQLGRIRDTRLAILWTAFLMTLWKPEQLWWDAGFQLSFAAVIGVTEIGPRLQKAFVKIPETLGLRDSLAATLAAQITTLPVSILTFGQVSLIAPLSNILTAPMVPIAMLLGFCGTMISMISFPLGQLIAFGGFGAAEWITGVAAVLAKVPFASMQL